MVPWLLARIPGSTALINATGPKKLVAKSASRSAWSASPHRRTEPVAGVVDKDVYPGEAGFGLPYRLGNL